MKMIAPAHPRQQGLSLVELMVALAVGMFVVATASFALGNQLGDNRRLMLATQVEQDLRAATDLVVRDLRRSGYWQNASSQLITLGAEDNPFSAVTAPDANTPGTIANYVYAHGLAAENAIGPDDATGIKLDGGALKQLFGDTWQPITDPDITTITALRIGMTTQAVDLGAYCTNPCGALANCPPVQQVRSIVIQLTGVSASDASVSRSLQSSVRLRNDRIVGHCAA